MDKTLTKKIIDTMMKKLTLALLGIILLAACGGSDDPSGSEPLIEAPRLVSSTPANGATNLPDGQLTVELIFDQNVTTPSDRHSLVNVTEGAGITSIISYLKSVKITLSGLAKGKSYQLNVPKGVVLGPTKLEAANVSLSFSTQPEPEPTPSSAKLCTPNPLKKAQEVYDYLFSIHGKKSLSGAMANVSWNIAEAELVYKATGRYPAIAFFDYIHLAWSPANWIDYTQTKVVEEWDAAGGLTGASWHWNVPATEADATDLNKYTCTPGNGNKDSNGNWTTTFRPKNIFTEGTWERKTVMADLEKMAGYLKLLKDKGIPVLWRPLHEAAGNTYEYTGGKAWFWWGIDGAETYRKLWKLMFDYFQEKGLNNLIWVWTSQTKDSEFYPGDAYVDIVGRDLYNETDAAKNASQYTTVSQAYSQKLNVLSECGKVGKISAQWKAGARWTYFMPWYQYNATSLDGHEHADTAWWKDAMSSDFVLSRNDLPWAP